IRKVSKGTITTVAGAVAGDLANPQDVAVDSAGNIYIADTGNNRVRKVVGSASTTVAAQLNAPSALAVASGNVLLIADTGNNAIKKLSGSTVTTIAGNDSTLSSPHGVRPDSAGNIYVADTQNNRILLLAPVPLSITKPSSLSPGIIGVVYPSVTFTASGGS